MLECTHCDVRWWRHHPDGGEACWYCRSTAAAISVYEADYGYSGYTRPRTDNLPSGMLP